MSLAYIRRTYRIPAKRGQRVIAYGKPGVITGSLNGCLRIRLDGNKYSRSYHPEDGIRYVTEEAK